MVVNFCVKTKNFLAKYKMQGSFSCIICLVEVRKLACMKFMIMLENHEVRVLEIQALTVCSPLQLFRH